MSRKSSWLVIPLACAALWHCANDPVSSRVPPRPVTTAEKTLAGSTNDFGFKLFREVAQAAPSTNVFISPLSVSMALGMAYNGASGTTREAMQKTLELSGLTIAQANQSYKSLIELLGGLDPEVQFTIANSIWHRQEFFVEPGFLEVNRDYFNAEVSGLDFSSPTAKQTINDWVKQKTKDKISRIVESIDPLTMMFLINAIYFKGTWTTEFDKKDTRDLPFYPAPAETTICKLMVQEGRFPYFENEQIQAIDLPYGNGDFSMTVLLPQPGRSIDSLVASCTAANWGTWIGSFASMKGTVLLPKFKLEYERSLKNDLTALGMGIAFIPEQADFTGINKAGHLFISEVKHKTFVDVNEEGTEAAAVTSVEIGTTSIGPEGFVLRVDRPFVFVIRDYHSGTLLFMGRIVEPKKA